VVGWSIIWSERRVWERPIEGLLTGSVLVRLSASGSRLLPIIKDREQESKLSAKGCRCTACSWGATAEIYVM